MERLEKTFWEENASNIIKDKKMSKADLAKALNIKPQNIGKWFETKSLTNLDKIAEVLDIPLTTLIFGNTQNEKRQINGFVEVDGTIYRISNKEDIKKLFEIID